MPGNYREIEARRKKIDAVIIRTILVGTISMLIVTFTLTITLLANFVEVTPIVDINNSSYNLIFV